MDARYYFLQHKLSLLIFLQYLRSDGLARIFTLDITRLASDEELNVSYF